MAAPPKAGGFKLSLSGSKSNTKTKFSLGNKSSSATANGEPLTKRARLVLDDDDDEDTNKGVAISGFDTTMGGAVEIDDGKKKESKGNEGRVIPALPNRNWRDEARRKRGETGPPGSAQNGNSGENTEQYQESKIQYGLTVVQKTDAESSENVESTDAAPEPQREEKDDGLTEDQRLEHRALKSLLSGEPSADSVRLIPAAPTEAESFTQDYATAPDAPSLDAYLATPIDGFGAALLRGMGWKDGDELGKGPKEIKRRPELLGIGAKEAEWKGGANRRREAYNPITLRSKKTGEMISESELKDKMEEEELLGKEKRRDKDKYEFSDDDRSGRSGRREKEKDRKYRDRERSKDRDRNRDRHYEKSRYRSRSRDRDDRRDRDKSDRREKGDRRDRDRDSHRDKDRRYRSRSRDSDRRKRRRDYDDDREPRKRHDRERDRDRDSGRDSGRDRDRGKDRDRDRHYRR